eukprot:scaffold1.g5466.t1
MLPAPHRSVSADGGWQHAAALPPLPPARHAPLAAALPGIPSPLSRIYSSPVGLAAAPRPSPPSAASCTVSPATASPAAPAASPDIEAATIPPSADEAQLQAVVSALRVALGKRDAMLEGLERQLVVMDARLQASAAEKRQLELSLLQWQAGAPPGGHAAAAPAEPALAALRQEVAAEAARSVELVAARDRLAMQLTLAEQQVDAAAQAEAKERERLGLEAAQCRLLARARARQLEHLQVQLQQLAAQREEEQRQAAGQAEAAQAAAAAAAQDAEALRAKAAEAEAAAKQLHQGSAALEQAAATAESRRAQAEAELADVRRHMEWQEQRIAQLEQSDGSQLARKYDAELQEMRAEFEAERARLQQELERARQQQGQRQGGLPQQAARGWAAAPDAAAWAELFDEPSLREQCDSSTQAEEASVGLGPEEQELMRAAQEEIEWLQEMNAALVASQSAGKFVEPSTHAQQALDEALARQQGMVSAEERDAAAQAAAGHERAQAQGAAHNAEAGWRARLELAQEQLQHQGGEVRALREANEQLELALHAVKEELAAQAEAQERVGRAPQEEVHRLRDELARTQQHSEALRVQVAAVKAAVQRQQQDHAREVARLQAAADHAARQAAEAARAAAGEGDERYAAAQAALVASESRAAAAVSELQAVLEDRQWQQRNHAVAGVQTDEASCSAAEAQAEQSCRDAAAQTGTAPRCEDAAVQAVEGAPVPLHAYGFRATPVPAHSPPTALAEETLGASSLQLELARVALTPSKVLPAAVLSSPLSAVRSSSRCSEELQPLVGSLGAWAWASRPALGRATAQVEPTSPKPSCLAGDAGEAEVFATPTCSILGVGEDEDLEEAARPSRTSSPSPSILSERGQPLAQRAQRTQPCQAAVQGETAAEAGAHEQENAGPLRQVLVPPLKLGPVRPASTLSQDSLWGSPHQGDQRGLDALWRLASGGSVSGSVCPRPSTSSSLVSQPASDSLPGSFPSHYSLPWSHAPSPAASALGVGREAALPLYSDAGRRGSPALRGGAPLERLGGSSMSSLDASLQRLAALTGTLGASAAPPAGAVASTRPPAPLPQLRELPMPTSDEPQSGGEDPMATTMAWKDAFLRAEEERARNASGRPGGSDDWFREETRQGSLLELLVGRGGKEGDTCGLGELRARRALAGDAAAATRSRARLKAPSPAALLARRPQTVVRPANWDLVLIYFGGQTDFRCPLCKAVYRGKGPKWRLAWRFTLLPEWPVFRAAYKRVMIADDDLVMHTCTVNTVFSVAATHGLLLSQPSICPAHWSTTPYPVLFQQPQNVLRYTTMVEIMAPVFEMGMFDGFIRPTLHDAYVGWGLDFVWPFLLKYPKDKIAVIDQVCVFHPPSTGLKSNSVYSADAPYPSKEEETRRFAKYGYFDTELAKLGMPFMPAETLGAVPRPLRRESLLETSNRARLGLFYPLLVFLQSLIIFLGCLAFAARGMTGRLLLLTLALCAAAAALAAPAPEGPPPPGPPKTAALPPPAAAASPPNEDSSDAGVAGATGVARRQQAAPGQLWLRKVEPRKAKGEGTSTDAGSNPKPAAGWVEHVELKPAEPAEPASQEEQAGAAAADGGASGAGGAEEPPPQQKQGAAEKDSSEKGGSGEAEAGVAAAGRSRPATASTSEAAHTQAYLESYFARQAAKEEARDRGWRRGLGGRRAARGGDAPPLVLEPGHKQRSECAHLWAHADSAVRRTNLIVAPVGDRFDASMWMSHPERANFDLLVIHFGERKDFACPLCRAVYSAKGPKWRLAYALSRLPDWPALAANYSAIMVADDDLIMDTCVLNRAFDLFHEHALLMAQPSVCDTHWTFTQWRILYQNPGYLLRHTTFIEIMAPIFDMAFFQGLVVPTLHNAFTGWGLDFTWPFLLKYPKDKIAVIDAVCMFHPSGSKPTGDSLYASGLPFSEREEEARRAAEYGYFESETKKLGRPYRSVEVLGGIPATPRAAGFLKQTADELHARLGGLLPLLLLAQTAALCTACLVLADRRLRGAGLALRLPPLPARLRVSLLARALRKEREGSRSSNGDSSTHSALFDLELTQRGQAAEPGNGPLSRLAVRAAGAAGEGGAGAPQDVSVSLPSGLLRRVVYLGQPLAQFELELLQDLKAAKERCCSAGGGPDLEAIVAELRAAGYACHIKRMLPTETSPVERSCLEKPRHSYIVCEGRAGKGGGAHTPCLADPAFREQFALAQPTRGFENLLKAAPAEFVGSTLRLRALVELLCAEMAEVFHSQGLPLPPWRRVESMLSKWLSQAELTCQQPTPLGPTAAIQQAAAVAAGGGQPALLPLQAAAAAAIAERQASGGGSQDFYAALQMHQDSMRLQEAAAAAAVSRHLPLPSLAALQQQPQRPAQQRQQHQPQRPAQQRQQHQPQQVLQPPPQRQQQQQQQQCQSQQPQQMLQLPPQRQQQQQQRQPAGRPEVSNKPRRRQPAPAPPAALPLTAGQPRGSAAAATGVDAAAAAEATAEGWEPGKGGGALEYVCVTTSGSFGADSPGLSTILETHSSYGSTAPGLHILGGAAGLPLAAHSGAGSSGPGSSAGASPGGGRAAPPLPPAAAPTPPREEGSGRQGSGKVISLLAKGLKSVSQKQSWQSLLPAINTVRRTGVTAADRSGRGTRGGGDSSARRGGAAPTLPVAAAAQVGRVL